MQRQSFFGLLLLLMLSGMPLLTVNTVHADDFLLTLDTDPSEVLAIDSGAVMGGGYYASGSLVLIDAKPTVTSGLITYEFVEWSTNDNAAAGPDELDDLTPTQAFIMMDGKREVTAIYELHPSYLLTLDTSPSEVLAIDSGAVMGGGYYASGSLARIYAKPTVTTGSITYEFDHWSSNDNSIADPDDVTGLTPTEVFIFMDGDRTVIAYYDKYVNGVLQYYLTLETSPPEISIIDPEAVIGEGYYAPGDTAIFSAKESVTDLTAKVKWRFVEWTFLDSSSAYLGNPAEYFMDGDYTFVANYDVDSYYLDVATDPPEVQTIDPTAVSGAGWIHSGSYGIVDAKQTLISGSYHYEFSHWLQEDQIYDDDDKPVDLPGNQAAHFMDGAYTMIAVYNVMPYVEWESSFTDSSSANSLKISVNDKLFQFSTPEKTYPIKQANVLTVRGSLFSIWHSDSDLIVAGAGILDPRIDFCIIYIRDVQTGKTYLVRDRIGPD